MKLKCDISDDIISPKMDAWDNFSTVTTFDTGDSLDIDLCRRSTKLIRSNDVITYSHSVTTPVSILVQSLVKELCSLLEDDNKKATHLYNTICEKLHQMQLLDESYTKGEFEDMRYQYQRAFNHLVKITQDSDLPLIYPTAWPIQSINSLSRYCREFEEVSFIAKGGFGRVYKAKNRLDEIEYAVKKVVIKANDLEDTLSKHLNEVKTLASLSHPNIVPYKSAWLEPLFNRGQVNGIEDIDDGSDNFSTSENSDYLSKSMTGSKFEVSFDSKEVNENNVIVQTNKSLYTDTTSEECKVLCKLNSPESMVNNLRSAHVDLQWATLYIQMSLCNKTLKTWLDERNSSPNINIYKFNSSHFKEVIDIFTQLVNGINYIHHQGIIHHDIKPTNIFIQLERGATSIQLADFGLACPLQRRHNCKTFGTPLYAAPEQIEGICHVKNDLYSVGFILLELIEFFNTSMEKDKTFRMLREGSLPVHVTANYPKIANIISSLAEKNVDDRLDTDELLCLIKVLRNANAETVSSLKKELEERDDVIVAKDKEISRLQELLTKNNISY